jgi:cytidyltransferase-like protein
MIKGVICGNFDAMHPGYIQMFNEMKKHCTTLVVLLHTDPSIERSHKLKPVLSADERRDMLMSLEDVDDVIRYTYEFQLLDLLKMGEFDIRFLGDDYIDKPFTGDELKIPIHYLDRSHGWSTTKFKTLIANSLKEVDERPWGKYEVLLDAPDVKVKRITVNPYSRLSYQYHEERREQWTVVSGILTVILDDERVFRSPGESIKIPLGAKHRAWNETHEPVVFIEVQTGTYFGEDDIIRIEDDYERH